MILQWNSGYSSFLSCLRLSNGPFQMLYFICVRCFILFPLGAPEMLVLCWNARFSISSRFSECSGNCDSHDMFPPGSLGAPEMLVLWWNSRFSEVFHMRDMLHILFPVGSPSAPEISVIRWNYRFSVSSRFSGYSRNFGSPVELSSPVFSIFKFA